MSPPKFWTVSSVRRGANLVVRPIHVCKEGPLSADFVEKVTCRADSLLIQFSQ
jgi:hypothetical protein